METIPIFVAIYSIILLIIFAIFVVKLRKVKRGGDERQIAIFYRASFDGMLGGIFGYLVVVLIKVLKSQLGISALYLSWVPSPIVVAVVTMYISYMLREKE